MTEKERILKEYNQLSNKLEQHFTTIKKSNFYKGNKKISLDILEKYINTENEVSNEDTIKAIIVVDELKKRSNQDQSKALKEIIDAYWLKFEISLFDIEEQNIKHEIINLIQKNAEKLIELVNKDNGILEREQGGHKFNDTNPIFSSLKSAAKMKLNIKDREGTLNGHNGHIIPNNKLEDVLKNYFNSRKDAELSSLCTYLKNISKYIPLKRFAGLINQEENDLVLSTDEAINLIAESVIWNPGNLTQAPEDNNRMPDYTQNFNSYPRNQVDTRALAKLENKILKNELIGLTKLLDIKPEILSNEQEKLSLVKEIIKTPKSLISELSKSTNYKNFLYVHDKIMKTKYDPEAACNNLDNKDVITILDAVYNLSQSNQPEVVSKHFKGVLSNIKPLSVDYSSFFIICHL